MSNYNNVPLSDDEFQDLFDYFKTLNITVAVQSYIVDMNGDFENETPVFNRYRFNLHQAKLMIDYCIKNDKIDLILSFFAAPAYLTKVPWKSLEYYVESVLSSPNVKDYQRLQLLNYEPGVILGEFPYNATAASKIVGKLVHKYKDKIQFSESIYFQAYLEKLHRVGLTYRDYNNAVLFNNRIKALQNTSCGLAYDLERFFVKDNLEDYLI